MPIGDYDKLKDPSAKGRTWVGGGVNSNYDVYCDSNGIITSYSNTASPYNDYFSANKIGVSISGEVENPPQYIYSPYVPLQVTPTIEISFEFLSHAGKIAALLSKIDKIRSSL